MRWPLLCSDTGGPFPAMGRAVGVFGPPDSCRITPFISRDPVSGAPRLRAPEFIRGSADVPYNINEGFILIGPTGHRPPIGRCRPELPEGGVPPAAHRPQD